MPEKMAKSARRATFGLPKVPVAVCTSLGLAGRPEKREYPRQIGSHPGNPGLFHTPLGGTAAWFVLQTLGIMPTSLIFPIQVMVLILMAYLSNRYLEVPIRALKYLVPYTSGPGSIATQSNARPLY